MSGGAVVVGAEVVEDVTGMVVSETAWLERLLLRLGADAQVVSGAEGVAAGAADRVLRRYGDR